MKRLITALDGYLQESPCSHSAFKIGHLPKGGIDMPLMVCGCKTDPVISSLSLHDWSSFLKPTDRIWESPRGLHFFHYLHPQNVGQEMLDFWQNLHPKSVSKIHTQFPKTPIELIRDFN